MEVFFEPTKGNPFNMRVEFSDTVEAVKEKIEELKGVPVGKQTLIYKDQILPDKTNFYRFGFFKPSKNESCLKIIVVITYVPPDRLLLTPEHPDAPPPEIMKVPVLMKLPVSNLWHCIEIDISHSVKKLKEIIGTLEGVAASRIVIRHGRVNAEELDDGEMLYNCGIDDFVELKVSLRPRNSPIQTRPDKLMPRKRTRESVGDRRPAALATLVEAAMEEASLVEAAMVGRGLPREEPAPAPAPVEVAAVEGDLTNEEIITVLLAAFGVMIPVEVHAAENVAILRSELERLRMERPELVLPEGVDIKFSYEEEILDENESFLWQVVTDGAIIHIVEAVAPDP